jgi:hypothetical protein
VGAVEAAAPPVAPEALEALAKPPWPARLAR